MEILKHLLPILLTVSLALLVVAAGIASSRGDFAFVVAHPSLLARAFVAIVVIPVITAVATVSAFPISNAAKAGIFLMAISPVPPLMPGKAMKLGGNAGYISGLQGAAALMALLTVPALGALGARLYDVHAQFPIGIVARNIFVGLVVPLAIGLAIGRWLFPKASPARTESGYATWTYRLDVRGGPTGGNAAESWERTGLTRPSERGRRWRGDRQDRR